MPVAAFMSSKTNALGAARECRWLFAWWRPCQGNRRSGLNGNEGALLVNVLLLPHAFAISGVDFVGALWVTGASAASMRLATDGPVVTAAGRSLALLNEPTVFGSGPSVCTRSYVNRELNDRTCGSLPTRRALKSWLAVGLEPFDDVGTGCHNGNAAGCSHRRICSSILPS